MLNENIKVTRKNKGFTQEELAIRLNVTSQTVSKWEKGYSVPDAEMLSKLAEVLETSVSNLLGEGMKDTQEMNQIAEQLARVNEQLAISNRRWRTIGKVLGIVAIFILIVTIGLSVLRIFAAYAYNSDSNKIAGKTEWICTLDGEEYTYSAEYNQNYRVVVAGGTEMLAHHIELQQYDDANELAAYIEDYFEEQGGTVTVSNQEGLKLTEYE